MRLGVYSDLLYRRDGRTYSTHQAFIRMVTALASKVDEVVIFGRVDPAPGRSHYVLPSERLRFVELPHYPSITRVGEQLRVMLATKRRFEKALADIDAVWIFGPHPMALLLALVARRHGVPLFLGARQDYPQYIRHRLPSRRWFWAVGAAHVLEFAFRRLARQAPTVVLGDDLARKYRAAGATKVLSTGFSLVERGDVVDVDEAFQRRMNGQLRVLSVGRLAPEKNPLLLAEVAAELSARDDRWRFVVAGDGPLEARLRERTQELGIGDVFEFSGYIPSGSRLLAEYRRSDAFLHVSLTEGLPQVIWEAQASGVPVVATDVGGVRGGLGPDGGLLIKANDAHAAVHALESLRDQVGLRRRCVEAGHANVLDQTTEAQLDRIMEFFQLP
jgi:glycosyltransferase involved in cell wall biosynthesis